MTPLEELRHYLQCCVTVRRQISHDGAHKWPYLCGEDFVLQHGKEYQTATLPKGVRRGIPQHCFHNAYELSKRKGWRYVEGYALSIIPVTHAWVVKPRADEVIEVTWAKCGSAYLGVEFDLSVVKRGGSVIDDWRSGWPLLTGELAHWQPSELRGNLHEVVAKKKRRRA